jgi:hypothetical protein
MATCLLLTLRALDELPKVRLRTAALFGLAFGLTVSVRIGGVMALVFLLAPIGLWLVERARAGAGARELARDAASIALALLPALPIAYAVMAVFWPWAVEQPLNPWRAFSMFSRFPYDGLVLFEGKLIPAPDLPSSYLPVLLGVTQPELLLVGVAGAALLGVRALARSRARLDGAGLRIAAVAIAAVLPVLYFIVARPTAYNGMRHFLFVVPSLTVLAALAFDRALRATSARPLRSALALGLALGCAAQLRTLIALHPNQYVYFNTLVGGPRGAQGRYELDYWGTSLAEATQRLARDLEQRGELPKPGQPPLKVYVCGNLWSAATYFPAWLAPERIEDADFQIAIAQFYCEDPKGSRRLLDVTRDGAVLSYVDDLRPGSQARSALR